MQGAKRITPPLETPLSRLERGKDTRCAEREVGSRAQELLEIDARAHGLGRSAIQADLARAPQEEVTSRIGVHPAYPVSATPGHTTAEQRCHPTVLEQLIGLCSREKCADRRDVHTRWRGEWGA